MSFSFDDVDEMDSMVNNMESQNQAYAELDAEVEKRFEVAMCYRTLLRNPLFSEQTEASQIAETRIREFIREQMELLLGMRSPQPVSAPTSDFDSDEITVLKTLAGKFLKKPALFEPRTPSQPTINPPPKPPAPKTKSKATTTPPKPTVKTTVRAKKEPVEGEVVEENGKRYRWVRNELGTLYRRDITRPVIPPNRIPILTGAALEAVASGMNASANGQSMVLEATGEMPS